MTDPNPLPLKIVMLDAPDGTLAYKTEGAAGMDIMSAETLTLPANSTRLVRAGFQMELPNGYEGQIRARSGLARRGIIVANAPGTVDSDYRGEVGVILHNLTADPYEIRRGDRIAQLVIAAVPRVQLQQTDTLTDTKRGADGYGSTGR